ncbi:transcription factor E4F1-like isoform X2 [Ruditapes philippinarum]|uniref:transcription factor E4F1-like isoform X2 n=1 Tax=Ruditapes philippinarum TaxID=129788 RepID=UPI00295A71EA|nr:transcription factor E4F1-like isoform X2 [Ruditapes philippinarum]
MFIFCTRNLLKWYFEGKGEVREIHEIIIKDEVDDDVHVCRRCNMVFYNIQKYLEHKVKHDNFKVKYSKSDVDKRMIMPTLIQRQVRGKKERVVTHHAGQDSEKENDQQTKTGKRGKRKLNEIHNQNLVITERPAYICSKCDRKFNREASLKRHTEYDHKEDSDDDDDDEAGDDDYDDDRDKEYRPNLEAIKEEIAEDEEAEEEMQQQAAPEMDSLDQVIMAAALVEKAEASQQVQGSDEIQVSVHDETGAVVKEDLVVIATPGNNSYRIAPKPNNQPAKRQKLMYDDKASRRFMCNICDNKFKELAVLKAHMLTHTNKRQYPCMYEGCTYAFKTKGSLKRHSRRHTGERPYPCELCGRTFTESGALTRHLKSRTPCTSKSDDDLPRYRKKWSVGTNVPASVAAMVNKDQNENQSLQVDQDNFVSVINIQQLDTVEGEEEDEEQLSNIHTVSDVLDNTVHNDENKHLFDEASAGVEVVIADGVETIIEDENIQQFVHSETVSQSSASVCKVCNEEYLSLEALRIHLRTHLAEDTCKCQLCHYITDNKEDFENHMFLHHHVQIRSSDPLTDLVSTRAEQNDTSKDGDSLIGDAKTALKQLMELPQDDVESETHRELSGNSYKCPVCNKQFRGSNYLKLHMRNHTGLRPHKCTKCERSFITRDTLKKHMATHIEDRNFKCGECGKLFKRLSHVREHIKIHSGVRPFPCNFCEKTFKTNNAMKVHLRTHTDILPYECSFCHRRFREKGSVVRHMRMHTGEKPYECQFCGRRFAEHGTLNRHLKAKVSCKKQIVMMKDYEDEDDTDYTVLAEFSSVVADTQQYIVPHEEADGEDEKQEEVTQETDDSRQTAEIVVVQTGDMEAHRENVEIENVEVVTGDGEETSVVEAVQVTDDYLVITDESNAVMRVLDRTTGETVAIVPMANMDNSDNQVQTITMSEEGEVSTVTMVPNTCEDVSEMVTIAQLIEGDDGLVHDIETEDGITTHVIQTVNQSEEEQGDTITQCVENNIDESELIENETIETKDS